MLGSDWQIIQQAWLHRLGNLTLTGYNSTYSDRAFAEKKTIAGGFAESSVRLNRFIREKATWTAAEIEARGVVLADLAVSIWPPLVVSEAAVQAARQEELRSRAAKRDVAQVPMDARARVLFEALRARVKELGHDVVEVPEWRSVSFHAADFFLEILPRTRRILLLLNLDFSECEASSGAGDATEYKFLTYAEHSGGAFYSLDDDALLEPAMRLVRQAYQLARG